MELKQPPQQQQGEETLYAEPILVNQSKPNPLGRIYSPLGKLSDPSDLILFYEVVSSPGLLFGQ